MANDTTKVNCMVPWADCEIDFVIQSAGKMSTADIAQKLGRSVRSVVNKVTPMGISLAFKNRRYTPAEVDAIYDALPKFNSRRALAEYMGIPPANLYDLLRRRKRSAK